MTASAHPASDVRRVILKPRLMGLKTLAAAYGCTVETVIALEALDDIYGDEDDTMSDTYNHLEAWSSKSVVNTRIRNEARMRKEAHLYGPQTAFYKGFFRARGRRDYSHAYDIACRAIEADLGDNESQKLNWLNRRDTMLSLCEGPDPGGNGPAETSGVC